MEVPEALRQPRKKGDNVFNALLRIYSIMRMRDKKESPSLNES